MAEDSLESVSHYCWGCDILETVSRKHPQFKLPKGEEICTRYYSLGGKPVFLMSVKALVGIFSLYEITDGAISRLGNGESPIELEEKFNVRKRMVES